MNFKEILDTLKLSSRDAIVNGEKDSFDDLKRYLHIERTVEKDLGELVINAFTSNISQLILIIGNVGDGKSHLLARMWEKYPIEMQSFYVHNDATESKSRYKSYLETLTEVLQPYSDKEIELNSSNKKIIIAINLGTLTNFLHEKGDDFRHLENYIKSNGILEDNDLRNEAKDRFISYINLADYHVYSLNENGPFSSVLDEIITKITQPVENNPFYQAYNEFYNEHPDPSKCPIKYNYDLLKQAEVKSKIIQLLIEAIVKYKLIVSVRLMMNLIYDIIVPPTLSSLSDKEIIKVTLARKNEEIFYKWILPWLLFESTNTSPILKQIAELDPVGSTNEALDQLIIKMGTTANPNFYFSEIGLLNQNDTLFEKLVTIPIFDRLKLFIRLNYIKKSAPELIKPDIVYYEFMKNLYYFHAHHIAKLIDLYRKTQKAIFHWNGMMKMEEDYLNVDIGRHQNRYRLSQKIQIEPKPVYVKIPIQGAVDRFSNTLVLGFKVNENPNIFHVKVDYGLFLLLSNINQGYKANLTDKNNHVDFKQFVARLSSFGAQNKDVVIQGMQGARHKRFKLVFTPGFNIFHFEEIQ